MSDSTGKFKNQNPNNAASDKWRLTIGDLVLVTRKVHDFSIPGVYSEGVEGPSPGNILNQISSDRLTFDPLIFTFIVDEDWENWYQIYMWIVNNSKANIPLEKDILVEMLDNQNRPVGMRIVIENSRPTAVDNVILDVDGDNPFLVTTVTFRYQQMLPKKRNANGEYQ